MATQQKCLNKQPSIAIVMVPYPEQSHLNQLLQLSHIISSHTNNNNNIKVHYAASALHVSQVTSRAASNYDDTIEFHAFPTPEFASPPPSNTEFPTHLIPCINAIVELRKPMNSLFSSLSEACTRLVVIHDSLMAYVVQDLAGLDNAEAYSWHSCSAMAIFVLIRDLLGLRIREDIPYHGFAMIPELKPHMDRLYECRKNKKSGVLYNSHWAIEGDFLDLALEKERKVNPSTMLWAVGPLETVTRFKGMGTRDGKYRRCLEWLDKQETSSVLYVSFGTTTFMKEDQIKELAIGLEHSGVKFIWVFRDADKSNIFDESDFRRPQLPQGYEERVERMGVGLVVREWAPQMEILGHPSTGGFLTHCGWNSCLESISFGVPLAAWPIHTDQPVNAFLLTQILKVGLVVREWEKKDELVRSSVISEVAKKLMNSEEGNEVRSRAEELGSELRKSNEEGGVSRLELDSFIAHITRTT